VFKVDKVKRVSIWKDKDGRARELLSMKEDGLAY
jgi:hypothetical protein